MPHRAGLDVLPDFKGVPMISTRYRGVPLAPCNTDATRWVSAPRPIPHHGLQLMGSSATVALPGAIPAVLCRPLMFA